jgi:UDP-N-acetylmuramate dehydrogenase
MKNFIHSLPQVKGQYRYNISLKNFSWFSVGGKAALLFMPEDLEDLQNFLIKLDKSVPWFLLGAGSNLLIRGGGFPGVVIKLGPNFQEVSEDQEGSLWFGAAILDQTISKIALNKRLGGFEFLSGIPGTLGGALAMNGGCYGRSISDLVLKVEAIDRAGNTKILSKEEMAFKYRGNGLNEKVIFTRALLKAEVAEEKLIIEELDSIKKAREASQPVKGYKTAGSTFKNPPGLSAWKVIEEAGCRGLKRGGVQVSPLHCNFFINDGTASAKDIEDLIELVEKKVFDTSGIRLERELIILGDAGC